MSAVNYPAGNTYPVTQEMHIAFGIRLECGTVTRYLSPLFLSLVVSLEVTDALQRSHAFTKRQGTRVRDCSVEAADTRFCLNVLPLSSGIYTRSDVVLQAPALIPFIVSQTRMKNMLIMRLDIEYDARESRCAKAY